MGHIHQMLPEHVPEAPKGAPRRTVTLTLIGTARRPGRRCNRRPRVPRHDASVHLNALSRPSGQRQPHAAPNQRHAGQAAEPSCRRPLQEQSAARTGGNRPAGIRDRGHRDRNDAHHRKLVSDRQIRIDKLRQKRCEKSNGFGLVIATTKPRQRYTCPRGNMASLLPPACRQD